MREDVRVNVGERVHMWVRACNEATRARGPAMNEGRAEGDGIVQP